MSDRVVARWFALIQRELQEYRVSLVWTPLVSAGALAALMLAGVLLANQFSNLGQVLLEAVMQGEAGKELTVRIDLGDTGNPDTLTVVTTDTEAGVIAPEGPIREDYQITAAPELADEQGWDFSRDWTFGPQAPVPPADRGQEAEPVESLNPLLQGVHVFMLTVLVFVSFNYLLGCLYDDRKDRSILFWRSMPVSARDEVLVKLAVALLVAPAVFIAASVLAQLATVLLAMLLVLRMDMDPVAVVLGNIQFGRLLLDQLGGWLLTALWVLPVYAWLLLASAGAKRSPFMLALVPFLSLLVLEATLLGSSHFGAAVQNHFPHMSGGGDAVGFYLLGPDWVNQDYLGLGLGLLIAAVLLAVTVWLRRYRWEI